MRPCGRHGRAHRRRPYPSPSYFSTQFHTNKITIHAQSTLNDTNHPCAIRPNETVGAVPVCPPGRPRSGVSIPKIHALCMGNLTMDAPLQGGTGGYTGTAPTHLHQTLWCSITHCAFDSPRQPYSVSLPHRGYTFDSAGLASATQPTLGNNASERATPLGVVLFLITHHHHTAANGLFANDFPT